MAEQPHGSEFLLCRLQRATAIPAAERSPDVAAFVESVQLLREASDLLPLTSDGRPALQFGSAGTHQQMATAMLKAARADYICPAAPVSDRDVSTHIEAYHSSGMSTDTDLLTRLLLCYTHMKRAESIGVMCNSAVTLLEFLATPAMQQAIRGQLAELAAVCLRQPLLSVEQLQYTCCCVIVKVVEQMIRIAPTAPQHQADGAAASLLAHAAAFILNLEPQNPKSYDSAASAEIAIGLGAQPAATQRVLRSAELRLQGAQLARQQGKVMLRISLAAVAAVQLTLDSRTRRASWQAAVAALEGAEADVRMCKRLLPGPWADGLEALVRPAQQTISIVQRQRSHNAGSAEAHFWELRGVCESSLAAEHRLAQCDGCREEAVGLRRCARCKTAQYCSTECQHKHWHTHKRECRKV